MKLVYLPTYEGAVETRWIFKDEPILCSDIKSLARMMLKYPTKKYYFCPIGKIIDYPSATGFRLTDGGAHLFYEYRRVYAVPVVSLMGAFIKARLPHLVVSDHVLGYDTENKNSDIYFDMSTPHKVLKLRVTRRDDLETLNPIMRSNGGIRIHISIGTTECVYPMEGKAEQIHPLLNMYFLHGISDKELADLFEIATRSLMRSAVVVDRKCYSQLKEYEIMVRLNRVQLHKWMNFLSAPAPLLPGTLKFGTQKNLPKDKLPNKQSFIPKSITETGLAIHAQIVFDRETNYVAGPDGFTNTDIT